MLFIRAGDAEGRMECGMKLVHWRWLAGDKWLIMEFMLSEAPRWYYSSNQLFEALAIIFTASECTTIEIDVMG